MQQPPAKPQNPKKRQVRLEFPRDLDAKFANVAVLTFTQNEIIMDFTQILPNTPNARVQTRVVMTPAGAKSFMQALQNNLAQYESRHGEIKTPPRPQTLADQLFSAVREDDDEDEDGDEDRDGDRDGDRDNG